MKRFLVSLIPLGLRTRLKWLGYAVKDVFDPVKDPRIPNRRDNYVGGGDFEAVGNAFLETLKRHGLKPGMSVLDMGCGQGRMARPLTNFLNEEGSYRGFDIVPAGIAWCQKHYADLENFRFEHADVFNARYNPDGKTFASEYAFPVEDDSIDLVFMTSVFTHMFADDLSNYLREVSRTLKPGGTSLITWFLLSEQSRSAPSPKLAFRHRVDDVSMTTLAENPEAAIAYDKDWVRQLYSDCGLEIRIIEYGHWSDPESPFDFQDLIVARKT